MAFLQDYNINTPGTPSPSGYDAAVHLSQYENGRKLYFRILGVDIPAGSSATISGTKPDGNVYSKAGTIDGEYVVVEEDVQMTAVAGRWYAKIHITNGNNTIATTNIVLNIYTDPVEQGAIPSDTQLDGIVVQCQAYAEAARSYAYGSPLTAATAAAMTDQTRVYVYTGSETGYTAGHWYYYDGSAWTDGGAYNSAAVQTDATLAIPGMAADSKAVGDAIKAEADARAADIDDVKEDLNTFAGNVEDYLYTEILDDSFVFTGIADFNLLDSTLYAGKQYIVKIKFQNITNNNLSKINAIRLYAGTSSLTAYDDLTFEVPYTQMHEGVVYSTYYTPSSTTRNTLLVAFGSNASFSTDSVEITINDMAIKFADKSVETLATESYTALSDLLNIADIEFTKGNYLKADGSLAPNNNFMVSDYISVLPNSEVQYSIHGYNSVAVLCMYTSDKTKTGDAVVSNTEQTLAGTLVIPANVAYIRVCRWATSKNADDTITIPHILDVAENFNEIEQQISDLGIGAQWQGKIWHCFGTSISNANNEGKYPPYLAALSGLQYVNFGYSGGKLTQQILSQIKNDASIANADLITVEGFVNDWSQQSPLGEITDKTADTFYGAMYEAITYILSNSNATLVFITDSTGRDYNSIDIRREAVRNGKTQNDFIQATIDMCHYMNIPVIDAGRKSCISQDTAGLYLVDQIHHTEKGGEQYANTIWAELKNIKPRIK